MLTVISPFLASQASEAKGIAVDLHAQSLEAQFLVAALPGLP